MNNRIKELREEYFMSQRTLSVLLGVSQETISAYESGRHLPGIVRLTQLSEILHASVDYILGVSDVRCSSLPDSLDADEIIILEQFRHLPDRKKEAMLSYLQLLMEK